jgi:hypothetical protein
MINFYDDSCFNHYLSFCDDVVDNPDCNDTVGTTVYFTIVGKAAKDLSQTSEFKMGRILVDDECDGHEHETYDASGRDNELNSTFFIVAESLQRFDELNQDGCCVLFKYVGLIHEYYVLQKTTRHSVYDEFEATFYNEILEYLNRRATYDTNLPIDSKIFDKYKKVVIPTIIEPK